MEIDLWISDDPARFLSDTPHCFLSSAEPDGAIVGTLIGTTLPKEGKIDLKDMTGAVVTIPMD